jgi:hypothetical protein
LKIENKPMNDEKTREDMIRMAKDLRAFYRSLAVSEETIWRAIKGEQSDAPKDEAPPSDKPTSRCPSLSLARRRGFDGLQFGECPAGLCANV